MELVEELRKPARTTIGVLSGKGSTEFKVLKAVAKKYDGSDKVLYLPKRPGYHPGSGLSVIKVVKIYVDKYRIKNYVCLIDKEHFTEEAAIEKEIEEKFREFGVEIRNVQKFSVDSEKALCIKGTVGVHEFTFWVAITGEEKCIEENIAKMIKIKFGIEIESTKNNVDKTLKERNLAMEKFIASASMAHLKASFPALNLMLSSLESDN